jgi:nucleotide-binding universal stress UspA family protein
MIRTGRAPWEIVQVAAEMAADLIIITTHGYTGLKHVLMGSTAELIVRHAPCPVLTVRDPEHDFVRSGG